MSLKSFHHSFFPSFLLLFLFSLCLFSGSGPREINVPDGPGSFSVLRLFLGHLRNGGWGVGGGGWKETIPPYFFSTFYDFTTARRGTKEIDKTNKTSSRSHHTRTAISQPPGKRGEPHPLLDRRQTNKTNKRNGPMRHGLNGPLVGSEKREFLLSCYRRGELQTD